MFVLGHSNVARGATSCSSKRPCAFSKASRPSCLSPAPEMPSRFRQRRSTTHVSVRVGAAGATDDRHRDTRRSTQRSVQRHHAEELSLTLRFMSSENYAQHVCHRVFPYPSRSALYPSPRPTTACSCDPLRSGGGRRTIPAAVGGRAADAEPARAAPHRCRGRPDPGRHRRHGCDRPGHRVGPGLPDVAAVLPRQLHPGAARRSAGNPPGRRVRQPDDHLPRRADRGPGGAGRHPRPSSARGPGVRVADACVDGDAGGDRRHHGADRPAVVDGGDSPAGLDGDGVAGRAAVREDRRAGRRRADGAGAEAVAAVDDSDRGGLGRTARRRAPW